MNAYHRLTDTYIFFLQHLSGVIIRRPYLLLVQLVAADACCDGGKQGRSGALH